jgi:hypothetical protein
VEQIQDILKRACEATTDSDDDVSYRNSYSGRGMYGRECVGIVGSYSACQAVIGEAIKDMVQQLFEASVDADDSDTNVAYDMNDTVQENIDKLMQQSSDSMGLDVIVYFTRIKPLSPDVD